jgi:FkbM family methyltransferase
MQFRRRVARWTKSVARRYGWEIRRSHACVGEMSTFLRQLRRLGLKPTNILDVGANETEWCRMARHVFPESKFVLIEPQVEMQPFLESFCAEAPGSRWELAGAGREAGELTLNVQKDHLAGSSLIPISNATAAQEQRLVPIVTIDSLYPDAKSLPELVKLDIQGFELEALAGATKLFGCTQCFIMEVGLYATSPNRPLLAEVVAFMDARNYKTYDIPGYLRRPLDGALAEVDLAFVLKNGVLDRDQRWC